MTTQVDPPGFVSLQVVEGKRTTIAFVEVMDILSPNDKPYVGIGEALRHSDDKHDPLVGQDLAIGRAFEDIGRQFQRQANGRVAMNDHNRKHSKIARAARKAQEHDRRVISRSRQALRDRRVDLLNTQQSQHGVSDLPHFAPPERVTEAVSKA